LQALALFATLDPPPSAAHLLNSHQIFVQDFAADRDWQKAVDRITDDGRRLVRKSQPAMAH
jgi:hypothetical protein